MSVKKLYDKISDIWEFLKKNEYVESFKHIHTSYIVSLLEYIYLLKLAVISLLALPLPLNN